MHKVITNLTAIQAAHEATHPQYITLWNFATRYDLHGNTVSVPKCGACGQVIVS